MEKCRIKSVRDLKFFDVWFDTVRLAGENFEFTKNNVNRNGPLHYYACALKQTHKCQSRAIIRRSVVTGEDGEDVVHNELLEVSTPEVY